MPKKVAVITPFFQRQPGLLRTAIQSVANQKNVDASFDVIVVDDGSPISADSEVAGLALPDFVKVRIVKQPNAGCYPACNTALNNIADGTDYVAFLDSDDEWFDGHMSNAIWALDNGYDLYFSDFYQLNQTVSAFQRDGRMNSGEHKKIHPTRPVYEYVGNLFDRVIKKNVFGTSVLVYSHSKLGDLRYSDGYRHTGAEYLLWLDMTARLQRAAFSAEPECRYGSGVNIFSEAGWGTDKFLTVRQDEIKWRKHVLASMALTDDQRAHVESKVRDSRAGFCLGLFHNVLHRKSIGKGILKRQVREDPRTFLQFVGVPFSAVRQRVRARAA